MLTRRDVALGTLLAPAAARAQATPGKPAPSDEQALFMAESRAGLYLPGLQRARAAAARDGDAGLLTQFCALVGDEAGALALERKAASKPPFPTDTVKAEPALDAVVRLSRGRRVVILNEAHHSSRCRAFGHALALRLRTEGFSTLAAETFSNEPGDRPALRCGQPVTFATGYYTRDPVFAEFVRGACAAGYDLAAYEERSDQNPPASIVGRARIPFREASEARNLAEVMSAKPDARILVYCGFSHATKVPQGTETWMAMRLRALTGADPLTINQSAGFPGPDREHEREGVTRVLDRFASTEPVSLTQADGRPWVFGYSDDSFDVQVVHPRLPPVDGRPGWLAAAPGRRPASAPLPAGLPAGALVQAVPREEAVRAVNVIPADQYPLPEAGVRRASFFLRPGAYLVRVETLEGRREVGRVDVPGAAS